MKKLENGYGVEIEDGYVVTSDAYMLLYSVTNCTFYWADLEMGFMHRGFKSLQEAIDDAIKNGDEVYLFDNYQETLDYFKNYEYE